MQIPLAADEPELPIEQIASILARACGHAGSGAECLFKTVAALQSVGTHDHHLRQLQHRIANEINTIYDGENLLTVIAWPSSMGISGCTFS